MTSSRVFTIREHIRNIFYASKAFVILKRSKKMRIMNKKLKERIMLSITEVNGCSMCSFVHTKLALSSGMSSSEIQELLSGNQNNVPLEDAVAVLFGTHFADSKEHPDENVISRLYEEYGQKKTELIVSASYVITMTNGMGTSMDHLYNRLKFKRNRQSNIINELANPILTMVFFPLLVLTNYFVSLFKQPRLLKLETV